MPRSSSRRSSKPRRKAPVDEAVQPALTPAFHPAPTGLGHATAPAEDMQAQNSLAVLIDADNANPAIIEGLLGEVAKYGVASVKRIYGDWTTPQLGSWKTVLL